MEQTCSTCRYSRFGIHGICIGPMVKMNKVPDNIVPDGYCPDYKEKVLELRTTREYQDNLDGR